MAYSYESEKKNLFTEGGQVKFLQIRDHVKHLLDVAGAFRMEEAIKIGSGDLWTTMACVDRLVELKEIVELPRECWAQYRIFTSPKVHNF